MKAKVNWIRDLFPFLPSSVPCCCFEWNQALRDSVYLCVCVREIQKWEELQVTGKWVWKKYSLVFPLIWVRKCQKMNKQANFRNSKHIFLVHTYEKDLIWISWVCITRKLFKIFCGLKCSGFGKRKSETHRTHSLLSYWEMYQQIAAPPETHHLYTHTPGRGSRRLRKGMGQRWQELSRLHDCQYGQLPMALKNPQAAENAIMRHTCICLLTILREREIQRTGYNLASAFTLHLILSRLCFSLQNYFLSCSWPCNLCIYMNY